MGKGFRHPKPMGLGSVVGEPLRGQGILRSLNLSGGHPPCKESMTKALMWQNLAGIAHVGNVVFFPTFGDGDLVWGVANLLVG